MINPKDYPILRAFLHREIKMFNWGVTGEKGRQEYVRRQFKVITSVKGDYDYVTINSITNMGLLDSKLVLSAYPWCSERSIEFNLPCTPRGNANHWISKK